MKRLVYVCNALDDETRVERRIGSDSPACTRKVFNTCASFQKTEVRTLILSVGRGKAGGSHQYFKSKIKRYQGLPIIYAPYSKTPIVSEIISLLWPIGVIISLNKKKYNNVFLFWNRTIAYIPALLTVRILKMKAVLDLEDGNIYELSNLLKSLTTLVKTKIYDKLTSHAIVTCSALKNELAVENVMCYYGTSARINSDRKVFNTSKISILFGGTISEDTGALFLIEVIDRLRLMNHDWIQNLSFIITGKGESFSLFEERSGNHVCPTVKTYGRITDLAYNDILNGCDVGLALKPKSGKLAQTTFPSKIVEMANYGLLIITTDISDVKKVLGEGALYINSNVLEFINLLQWVVENKHQVQEIAKRGNVKINELCSPESTSEKLMEFLFD